MAGKIVKKWGETALAAACVLTIVFAALYTRQDDLRRMAARNAAASNDERLLDAEQPAVWQRPVSGRPLADYAGAVRSESGLWTLSPVLRYQAAWGETVRAMGPGLVAEATDRRVRLLHGQDTETLYLDLQSVRVRAGETVTAGQPIGSASNAGYVSVCARKNGAWIDPERLVE